MLSKINCWNIVVDQFGVFHRGKERKTYWPEIGIIYGVPIVLALLLVWAWGYLVEETLANMLATALSIFSALLFSLLLLVHDFLRREQWKTAVTVLMETEISISYGILLTVNALFLVLFSVMLDPSKASAIYHILHAFDQLLSAMVFALVIHFFLTLRMVLKRTHEFTKRDAAGT